MASLQSGNLVFEYKIDTITPSFYITSKVRLLHKNTEILNPRLMKNLNYFSMLEYIDKSLIYSIDSALQDDKFTAFECVDGMTEVGIYPGEFFPFLGHKSKEVVQDTEKPKKIDFFTLIVLISGKHIDCNGSTVDGVSLHLWVSRDALEEFVSELRAEYEEAEHEEIES